MRIQSRVYWRGLSFVLSPLLYVAQFSPQSLFCVMFGLDLLETVLTSVLWTSPSIGPPYSLNLGALTSEDLLPNL